MSEGTGKSRRRFLADMLFLGGGLTAAAMLARAGCHPQPQPGPDVDPVGCDVFPSPAPDECHQPARTPVHEEVIDPKPRVPVDRDPFSNRPETPPAIRGQVAIPQPEIEPNPAGGMTPPSQTSPRPLRVPIPEGYGRPGTQTPSYDSIKLISD